MRPALITIKEMELLKFEPPKAEIRVVCSKGTYIRSLARDLGVEASSGAHLTNLRRTVNGDFKIEDALSIEDFIKLLQNSEA